jgi:hypothetical protein
MRLLLTSFAFVACAVAAGCNPYDPDLGNAPFECGTSEPRCPEGFTCHTYSDTNEICERTQSSDVDAPGGTFQCANDSSIEPNNDVQTAFVTPIPSMPSYSLVGLSVCPTGDRDHYRFDINVNGLNFEATVAGVANRTSLSLNVLTAAGALVASGRPVGGNPQVVKIAVENRLAVGSYIVQVQSPDNTENNYDLTLKVCSTTLPCP